MFLIVQQLPYPKVLIILFTVIEETQDSTHIFFREVSITQTIITKAEQKIVVSTQRQTENNARYEGYHSTASL